MKIQTAFSLPFDLYIPANNSSIRSPASTHEMKKIVPVIKQTCKNSSTFVSKFGQLHKCVCIEKEHLKLPRPTDLLSCFQNALIIQCHIESLKDNPVQTSFLTFFFFFKACWLEFKSPSEKHRIINNYSVYRSPQLNNFRLTDSSIYNKFYLKIQNI